MLQDTKTRYLFIQKNVTINHKIRFNSMTKIAFTSVLLYKVIATLRNYHKDFSCTHLVSAKCQNRKDNYLKVGNHSRHLPSTCRFLSDRYVVF